MVKFVKAMDFFTLCDSASWAFTWLPKIFLNLLSISFGTNLLR